MEAFPCIALEKNTSTRTFMDAFLAQQGTLLKPEFELAISDMIVQFARRNMGIGCVNGGICGGCHNERRGIPAEIQTRDASRHMCVVTGESSLISMPGRRLLDMMACDQAAAEHPAGGR
ncbi:MAG: LysR substrate-binding domain-containing protein [Enterocloster sp.]